MPAPEGERIRAVEVELVELRREIREQIREQMRSRSRLHELESTTQSLIYEQRQRDKDARRRAKRQDRWFAVLTLTVTIAGIVTPLVHGGVIT